MKQNPPESKNYKWATPQDFVDLLAWYKGVIFTLDPCAEPETTKCPQYFTVEDDGLTQSWEYDNVFCNPPYGDQLSSWVEKCLVEAVHYCPFIALLIPPRTDNTWWHKFIPDASEIIFLKGRIPFEDRENPRNNPNDPNCIIIYRHEDIEKLRTGFLEQKVSYWDWKEQLRRFKPTSLLLSENKPKKTRANKLLKELVEICNAPLTLEQQEKLDELAAKEGIYFTRESKVAPISGAGISDCVVTPFDTEEFINYLRG